MKFSLLFKLRFTPENSILSNLLVNIILHAQVFSPNTHMGDAEAQRKTVPKSLKEVLGITSSPPCNKTQRTDLYHGRQVWVRAESVLPRVRGINLPLTSGVPMSKSYHLSETFGSVL